MKSKLLRHTTQEKIKNHLQKNYRSKYEKHINSKVGENYRQVRLQK